MFQKYVNFAASQMHQAAAASARYDETAMKKFIKLMKGGVHDFRFEPFMQMFTPELDQRVAYFAWQNVKDVEGMSPPGIQYKMAPRDVFASMLDYIRHPHGGSTEVRVNNFKTDFFIHSAVLRALRKRDWRVVHLTVDEIQSEMKRDGVSESTSRIQKALKELSQQGRVTQDDGRWTRPS